MPPISPIRPQTQSDDEIFIRSSDATVSGDMEDGTYEARVVSLVKGFTQKGDPCLILTVSAWLTPGGKVTKELKTWLVMTEAAMWKVLATLRALGLSEQGKDTKFKASDAVNRMCLAVVKSEEYNGEKRPSLKSVQPWPKEKGGKGTMYKPVGFAPKPTPPRPPVSPAQEAYDTQYAPADTRPDSFDTDGYYDDNGEWQPNTEPVAGDGFQPGRGGYNEQGTWDPNLYVQADEPAPARLGRLPAPPDESDLESENMGLGANPAYVPSGDVSDDNRPLEERLE